MNPDTGEVVTFEDEAARDEAVKRNGLIPISAALAAMAVPAADGRRYLPAPVRGRVVLRSKRKRERQNRVRARQRR